MRTHFVGLHIRNTETAPGCSRDCRPWFQYRGLASKRNPTYPGSLSANDDGLDSVTFTFSATNDGSRSNFVRPNGRRGSHRFHYNLLRFNLGEGTVEFVYMEEPLLSFPSPRRRAQGENSLSCLPENQEVTLPVPNLCLNVLKQRLIFGGAENASPDLSGRIGDSEEESRIDDGESEHREREAGESPRQISRNKSFIVDVLNEGSSTLLLADHPEFSGPCRRKNLHRSRTAPAMAAMSNVRETLKRPELDSAASIVKQAVVGLVIYLSLGVLIYSFNRDQFSGNETYPIVDALYFCIVTMCTIGYGDITPETVTTKLFACLFVLVGFGFIDILLSGMVTYVLDKQEDLLLTAVEGNPHDLAATYFVDVKKGRMRIRMKVALALGVVILCIGVGTAVMHTVENLGWLDSFYLSVMSVTTVGYGDHAFKTLAGRLFASIWLLVSTLAVARAFLYLAEARIDKRHRLIAKWVLHRDMTVADLMAADIDNNGFVSKSEYVIYKLKEMGKVEEKDIVEICKQFNRLDTDNCGKITLSYLLSGH